MKPLDLGPEALGRILAAAHEQVATALWLSAGMLCALAALFSSALRWRRAALGWGFAYSLTLCFVHNGHAQILGPIGCTAAAVGLFWPARRPPP